MSKQPAKIPKGWKHVKIGEFAQLRKGLSYKSEHYSTQEEGLPFLTLKSIQRGGGFNNNGLKYYAGYIDERAIVKEGDLIIANTDITRDGAVVGAPMLLPNLLKYPALISMDLSAVDVNTQKVDRQFLYYFLCTKTARNFMHDHSSGSTVLHLKTKDVPRLELNLPPLPEQKKIAEILGTVDEEIQKTDEIIATTEKLKRGLTKTIFSFSNVKGIKYLALGDIGKVSMCKRVFKEETSPAGDIPFYKIGTFGKEPDAFITQELFDCYRKKFSFPKIGDVLLSASGTIGRKVIYDGKPAYFQDSNIIWLEHDESKVLNSFLFFLYDIIQWQTEGSTIKRLYNNLFLKKVVPVPPISEQKHIVEILSVVDQKISINHQLKNKMVVLKRGLMRVLLNGIKRVRI